jgi:protein-S-isoprenylcysteine O-methyltransferase Ste14
MEWHQHLYEEERRRSSPTHQWRWALLVAAAWVLLRVLRRFMDDVLGPWVTAGVFSAIVGLCLYLVITQQRRKRRAWEAARGRACDDATR